MNSRLVILTVCCLSLAACHRSEQTPAAAKDAATEKKGAEPENEDLKISKESQEVSGIKLAPVQAASLAPAMTAFGKVLDPGLLIQEVSDLATARAASDASTRDLERTRKLNTMGENASARALETAEAAARRDALAADLASQKIIASWGTLLASREDLPVFVQHLVRQDAALVRIDIPAGQVLTQPPVEITLTSPSNNKQTWTAQFISFAGSADPQSQTQGLIAVVEKDPPPTGLAVIAKLAEGGEPRAGVRIPRSAVVRYGDGVFVYVQKSPETFERHAVTISGELGDDFFATDGIAAGDSIVVAGAQQLLSEETKGSAPAGD